MVKGKQSTIERWVKSIREVFRNLLGIGRENSHKQTNSENSAEKVVPSTDDHPNSSGKPDKATETGKQTGPTISELNHSQIDEDSSINSKDEIKLTDSDEQTAVESSDPLVSSDSRQSDEGHSSQSEKEKQLENADTSGETEAKSDDGGIAEVDQTALPDTGSSDTATAEGAQPQSTHSSYDTETTESSQGTDEEGPCITSIEGERLELNGETDSDRRTNPHSTLQPDRAASSVLDMPLWPTKDSHSNSPIVCGQTNKTKRQPRKAGGRRIKRDPRQEESESIAIEKKPVLICRENKSEWKVEVVLTIPEEKSIKRVMLNGEDITNNGKEYQLTEYKGKLTIDTTNSKKFEIELVGEQKPLIFKMKKNWEGEGRHLEEMTKGHFIVVAPSSWTRKGSTKISEKICSNEQFKAHYFFVDEDSDEPAFNECSIPRKASSFDLVGDSLDDDSHEGKLFVNKTPLLDRNSEIVWARVGEEGKIGWGENFRPANEPLSKVLSDRDGHFFMRVYDEDINLLDSDHFRYSSALKRILVNGEQYKQTDKLIPPLREGHRSVEIKFVNTNGENISPESIGQCESTINGDDSVNLRPSPNNDRTEWKLPSGKYCVQVAIELQRIWWKIGNQDKINNDWCDKPIVVQHKEFRSLGQMNAKLEFRPKDCIKSGKFGLENEHDTVKVKLKDGLNLSQFLDYKKISAPLLEQTTLKLFIEGAEVDLINIEPDPIEPEPGPSDKLDEGGTPSGPDVDCGSHSDHPSSFTPQSGSKCAWVRKGGSNFYRKGKGFSEDELVKAGITPDLRKQLSLPVDKRRNTIYQHNIDILVRRKEDAKVK